MKNEFSRKYANSLNKNDLMVFSHLRWDFVFQRPQHLLTRFAKYRRVFFFEEPIFGNEPMKDPHYLKKDREQGVVVIVPLLSENLNENEVENRLRSVVDQVMKDENIQNITLWYYTPMALPFTEHLDSIAVVFDCMDELSAFKGASEEMHLWEDRLMEMSDVVFTGGYSLYEAKKHRHSNIYPFPSSIDHDHFKAARSGTEPEDQKCIPHPRIGFFGVIDERMDIELVDQISKLKPDWHFVFIGPVVKIDPATLPKRENIHYLGQRSYQELPKYISGWDLAILPFARNESTRFISPTKTPEYLAAGRPVVSTSIRDVVDPYATEGLVSIADKPEEFVLKAERAMHEARHEPEWILRVDEYLEGMSWDVTFAKMASLEHQAWLNNYHGQQAYEEPWKNRTNFSISPQSVETNL
ncbi:MAG: glycosyltransferase family 1 protein [Pseudobdellovibrionaceae bacterium]